MECGVYSYLYTWDVILAKSWEQLTNSPGEHVLLYSYIKVHIYAGMGCLYYVGNATSEIYLQLHDLKSSMPSVALKVKVTCYRPWKAC